MLDGELIIPVGGMLSFEALQLRLHPAESRVRKLAAANPAQADAVRLPGAGRQEPDRGAARRAAGRARGVSRRARTRGSAALALHLRPRDARVMAGAAPAARWTASIAKRPRRALSARRAGDAQGQADAHRRLRGRRLSLRGERRRWSARSCSASTTMAGKLDHVGFTSAIPAADKAALTRRLRGADRAAGLHRRRAGRAEPLEHRADRRMAAAAARAGRRGPLRPCHRRPLPPRHQIPALAARQGARAMPDGPAPAEADPARLSALPGA